MNRLTDDQRVLLVSSRCPLERLAGKSGKTALVLTRAHQRAVIEGRQSCRCEADLMGGVSDG